MRPVYVVYSGDCVLSVRSLDVIAVATTKKAAIRLVKQHARIYGEQLSKDDLACLESHLQTQGRDCNYHIEVTEKNVLI